MATKGRLECRITIPTGGWSFDLTESGGGGGPHTVTLAAGDYYATELATEFDSKLDASAGTGAYTVTASLGESGTGKLTFSVSGITEATIDWTNTTLRDLVGFTTSGVFSPGIDHTGTRQIQSVWLPNCVFSNLNGGDTSWAGWDESDLRGQESAAGHTFVLTGQRKSVQSIRWDAISRNRVWIANETTVNESLQSFWRKGVLAEASWTKRAGGPLRWFPDAGSATYITYTTPTWKLFRPGHLQENWTGLWRVELERLVEVPS